MSLRVQPAETYTNFSTPNPCNRKMGMNGEFIADMQRQSRLAVEACTDATHDVDANWASDTTRQKHSYL